MARSYALTYRCVIENQQGEVVGSLEGQKDSDVSVKVVCNAEDILRGSLTFKVNVAAPVHLHCKDNRFCIEINLHNTNTDIVTSTAPSRVCNDDVATISD